VLLLTNPKIKAYDYKDLPANQQKGDSQKFSTARNTENIPKKPKK